MKKLFIPLLFTLLSFGVKGQTFQRLSYTTTLGTGIPMNEPACTPFLWQVMADYSLSQRFMAGAGTGLSCYEKILVPVFAHAKFLVTPPHRFTPYLDCNIGYAFAPSKQANGGLYLNPSIGVEYAFQKRMKLLLAIGYELQKLKRLKDYEDNYLKTQFCEKLGHHTLILKAGVVF